LFLEDADQKSERNTSPRGDLPPKYMIPTSSLMMGDDDDGG
jgi:hypothetical protein